jgi:hypothetical protein
VKLGESAAVPETAFADMVPEAAPGPEVTESPRAEVSEVMRAGLESYPLTLIVTEDPIVPA